jgi:hypothetical protein
VWQVPVNAAVLVGVVHRWLAFLTAETGPRQCATRAPTAPKPRPNAIPISQLGERASSPTPRLLDAAT